MHRLASFSPHLCLRSPPYSRGAPNSRCGLPLHWHPPQHTGQVRLCCLPPASSPGRGGAGQGNENPPRAPPPPLQASSSPLNGSFVFAKNKPETHPAAAIVVCWLLCRLDPDSVTDLVIETSTCLLGIQGSHLIIFKISGKADKAFTPLPPSFASPLSFTALCWELIRLKQI